MQQTNPVQDQPQATPDQTQLNDTPEKVEIYKRDVIDLTGKCGFNAPIMKYAIVALNAGYRYFRVNRYVHEVIAGDPANNIPNRVKSNVCHVDDIIKTRKKK